jgi:hypothetical protein
MSVIDILALAKLGYIGVERDKRVSRTKVQSVVNAPINLKEKNK